MSNEEKILAALAKLQTDVDAIKANARNYAQVNEIERRSVALWLIICWIQKTIEIFVNWRG